MMKRLEKVKPRVSWAQGPNFCQVKVFRKEDPPTKVGRQAQPHNFSKQSSGKPQEPDDDPDLPPGFENYWADKPNVSNIPQIKWDRPLNVSNIPQITWKQPPKFFINDVWLVKNGEESTENKNRSKAQRPSVGIAQEQRPYACIPSSSSLPLRINGSKILKHCNYFGTANGCRNGDRCRFIHDRFRPNIQAEAPGTKRWKFGK